MQSKLNEFNKNNHIYLVLNGNKPLVISYQLHVTTEKQIIPKRPIIATYF